MPAIQCTTDNPCVMMQLLTQKLNNEEERIDKMEQLIEGMRNRLPVWATLALTAGGGVIGILVGLISKG